MKLKICGMKYNTSEVAALQPDYLGFIFYDKSPRNFEGVIPDLPKTIKKVGVFVNADINFIQTKVEEHNLDYIQLHGQESPEYLKNLLRIISDSFIKLPKIIKVFSVKDEFDFSQLRPYKNLVDYYLFDTKGKLPGGNGYTFNWDVLKDYPSTKPYFLSGGIGLDEMNNILSFLQREESKYCHAIDINSKFEINPGLKNINELEKFIYELQY